MFGPKPWNGIFVLFSSQLCFIVILLKRWTRIFNTVYFIYASHESTQLQFKNQCLLNNSNNSKNKMKENKIIKKHKKHKQEASVWLSFYLWSPDNLEECPTFWSSEKREALCALVAIETRGVYRGGGACCCCKPGVLQAQRAQAPPLQGATSPKCS